MPSQQGNSSIDKFGCLDTDGDGYSNDGDDLPDNPTQYFDLDGDGYGDNRTTGALQSDAFPMNPYQWHDNDGDGYGDNVVCVHYDAHPNDVNAWAADDECDIEDDDGFEFMIPGTKITISAWDLVGIFTGVQLLSGLFFPWQPETQDVMNLRLDYVTPNQERKLKILQQSMKRP